MPTDLEKMITELPRPNLDMKKIGEIHQAALRAAAGSRNPVIAELAREVQAGRLTLRDAMMSPAYGETLAQATDTFLSAVRDKSPDELMEETGEETLDAIVDKLRTDDEQPDDSAAEKTPAVDDDAYFGADIMTGPSRVDRATPVEPEVQPEAETPAETGTEPPAEQPRRRPKPAPQADDEYFDAPIMTGPSDNDRSSEPNGPPSRARWNRRR